MAARWRHSAQAHYMPSCSPFPQIPWAHLHMPDAPLSCSIISDTFRPVLQDFRVRGRTDESRHVYATKARCSPSSLWRPWASPSWSLMGFAHYYGNPLVSPCLYEGPSRGERCRTRGSPLGVGSLGQRILEHWKVICAKLTLARPLALPVYALLRPQQLTASGITCRYCSRPGLFPLQ